MQLNKIYIKFIFIIYGITTCHVMGFFSGLKNTFSYLTGSEMCDKSWITHDIHGLRHDLEEYVFGQELAIEVVLAALQSYTTKTTQQRSKPLVINFHGWPGGGKGYVADFILKNWYKKGKQSKFVKMYQARLDFPLKSLVYEYQRRLQNELEETVGMCPKAIFVFDEVDKFPPHVLDGIKPYLDYNNIVNGHDFRDAIFIFITNHGESQITNIALRAYEQGMPREELRLKHFERLLKVSSFNDEGGFFRSDLIKHHVIDYMVPFLPLERKHVTLCVKAEMKLQNGPLTLLEEAINDVMEEFIFGPDGQDLFSVNGCKGVDSKVSVIIERDRRKKLGKHKEF